MALGAVSILVSNDRRQQVANVQTLIDIAAPVHRASVVATDLERLGEPS
jgi:hypothetical protein